MEPEEVTFQLIREMTDDFSSERKLGEGSFGVVYRGVTHAGEDVAVKMLKPNCDNTGSKQFKNEIYHLGKLRHQNIVRVLGYCYEIEKKPMVFNGKIVLTEETHRAICLDYLHNGSLHDHLSDEFGGLDWDTRFKIIKGTCEGLKYFLHDLEEQLCHLDLKPDNILLDKDMSPKIADFGLSMIFDNKELKRTTQYPLGTHGYQPPEYIDTGEVSDKFDIFSLGVVMIMIVSGPKGYHKCGDMSLDEFTNQVQKNWRHRLQATCNGFSLEMYCHQVETCIQIALNCVEKDWQRRPDIVMITEKLNEIETNNCTLPWNEFKDITCQPQNIKLMTGPNFSELEFVDAQETSSDVVKELIVGREKEKGEIMASLLEVISEKIIILPIHGIGGIGKTTFARLIYNDPEFKCYSHVWVDVSQRFGLNKIRESIVSQLCGEERLDNERQMMHNHLTNLLSHKNILIVLDDLWEDDQFKLKDLKEMLYNKDSNIIILVTTRSEDVANRICTNLKPHRILPLTNGMCWDIIKQRSGFEARDDKEQLEGIGLEIAQKCSGVALAAQSLGFTLRSMNINQWMKVKDSDIWNSPNHVLASLKLSYSYMDRYLKTCFTYCAIFPKGHKMVKDDLIYQWISLDFIKPTKLLSNMHLCEKHILQLLGLSFFQQYSLSPKTSGAYHEEVILFTMHDLVHDLARSVLGDEILDTSKQVNTRESCYKYALLNDCSKPLELSIDCPDSLRALCFLQCAEVELCGAAFSPANFLRVLDLGECCIKMLPDSIGQLEHLRYINAPGIQDQTRLPYCITGLSKLIYLGIPGSSAISALPVSFGEIKNLMHLDLSGCSGIEKLPESFGNLKRLVHLNLSNCSKITGVSEYLGNLKDLQYLNLSYCRNIGKLPEVLRSLSKVRYLNLSCCSYLEEYGDEDVFGALTKLEYLNLSSRFSNLCMLPEDLGSFSRLKYLNLSGCQYLEGLPTSFGNLTNLVHLDLSYCSSIDGILDALGGLTKLQFLDMHDCYYNGCQLQHMGDLTELKYLNLSGFTIWGNHKISSLIERISVLTNLEHLDLSGNESLHSLPECIGNLRKLHTLDLSDCNNLKKLPKSIEKISTLKFLIADRWQVQNSEQSLSNTSFGWLPRFEVQIGEHQSSSNLVLLEDANLTIDELAIRCLENVMSTQEARAVQLMEKRSIENLTLEWTGDAQRFVGDMEVLTELVPPGTLEKFIVQGYCCARFPDWMMKNIHGYLPNLVEIEMYDLPKCNMLPPLGKLPNLESLHIEKMDNLKKIDEGFYGGTKAFPKLNNLFLCSMQSLEEWNTTCSHGRDGMKELMFPSLKVLKIYCCPKLRVSPCPRRAEDWHIVESDNVLLSGEEVGQTCASSSAAVRNLKVKVQSNKVPLHQWRLLQYLPAITTITMLKIISGNYLTRSTPEIMQNLSALQSLSLKADDQHVLTFVMGGRLAEMPPQSLSIKNGQRRHMICNRQKLPKWVGELRSLKELEISGYRDIEAPVEIMKQLSSLQSLKVHHCARMTKLPEWLGELTSLQELIITVMPQLNNFHENMRHLVSLRSLELWQCENILVLPEWLGDLSALEELNVSDCSGIKSLPQSITRLTKLTSLSAFRCPGLDRWHGSHEIRMKLHTIKAYSDTKPLLEINPPEIRLPFEVKKLVSCSLTLTNNTEDYIAYILRPTDPHKYFTLPNTTGTVLPCSTCSLTVLLFPQEEAPSSMPRNDRFIVQAIRASEPNDITADIFDQNATEAIEYEVYLNVTYVAVSAIPPGNLIE